MRVRARGCFGASAVPCVSVASGLGRIWVYTRGQALPVVPGDPRVSWGFENQPRGSPAMRPSHLTLLASHGLTFLSWLRGRGEPLLQGEGQLVGGEHLKGLGFIVAVSTCAGSGVCVRVSGRVGVVCVPGVRAARFGLSQGALCVEAVPLSQPPGGIAQAAQTSRPEGDRSRPQVDTVSSVHGPGEPQRSGLHCWAPPGSGAPHPWLTWGCGWQPDQDLLGVPRRIHHTQVQEAQEGLRLNAGHVKPVCPGPRGGHEGGCRGRGPQPS